MRRPLLAVLPLFAALAVPVAAQSPWELLEKLRSGLQAEGPLTAPFVQTYVPAGFSTGDSERGHLSMWLPDCLRWSYEEPQPKCFLLCGGEVYQWVPGEAAGRRFEVEAKDEPGLDLLLLSVESLRERYVASSARSPQGGWDIELATPPEAGRFHARLSLDAAGKRVTALEYTDDEGNRTRFELGAATVLRHTALFRPPVDVTWSEE